MSGSRITFQAEFVCLHALLPEAHIKRELQKRVDTLAEKTKVVSLTDHMSVCMTVSVSLDCLWVNLSVLLSKKLLNASLLEKSLHAELQKCLVVFLHELSSRSEGG